MKNIFKGLGTKIVCAAKNVKFQAHKHSPEILVGIGIVTAGAAVVMACKQTMKMDKILDDHKETIEKINELVADDTVKWQDEKGEVYSYDEKCGKGDKIICYRNTTWKIIKNYALPFGLFILSMSCFVGSTAILKKRNAALATAFNGLLAATNAYRQRVADKIGKDAEEDLFLNRKSYSLSEVKPDGTKEEKIIQGGTNIHPGEPFVFKFNRETAPTMWDRNPEMNLYLLKNVEKYVNDMVFSDFHSTVITLPEVLKKLGMSIPKDKNGLSTKWLDAGWVSRKHGGSNWQCDFGLDKYSTGEIPYDEIVLEMNCECISALASNANDDTFRQ